MTDITDQDTARLALAWAEDRAVKKLAPETGQRERDAAVRFILAAVEAPAPTLAEEVKKGLLFRVNDTDAEGIKDALDLAARVEQIEQERDQARSEAKAWEERFRAAKGDSSELAYDLDNMEQRALEAEAEVERLAAEHVTDPSLTLNDGSMTPDPADVPYGEAWLIGRPGAPGIGVRNCPHTDFPWTVVEDEGRDRVMDSGIVLRSRLVPAPRVITNPDELDQAKHLTVIRDGVGVVCERASLGDEWFPTGNGIDQTPYIQFPVTVLWEPDA